RCDQIVVAAEESRPRRYSWTGKRPVKPQRGSAEFRPCRAPDGAERPANDRRSVRPGRAAGPAPVGAGLLRSAPRGWADAAPGGLAQGGPVRNGPALSVSLESSGLRE